MEFTKWNEKNMVQVDPRMQGEREKDISAAFQYVSGQISDLQSACLELDAGTVLLRRPVESEPQSVPSSVGLDVGHPMTPLANELRLFGEQIGAMTRLLNNLRYTLEL